MALTNFTNGQVLTETEMNKIVTEVNAKATKEELNNKAPKDVVSKSANGLVPQLPNESTTTKYLRQDGTWAVPPDTKYTHPSGAGNNHIPSGGSANKVLKWSADGVAVWGDDKDTTYTNATTSNAGLMSVEDKKKLDGIAGQANNYVHPTGDGNKHIPSGGSAGQILRWSEAGTAVWGADNNTTYAVVSKTANGLAPQLPNEEGTTKYLRQDGTWVVPPDTKYVGATQEALGLVKKMPTQADSTAEDVGTLVADFNALLAKLKSAGIMA